MTMHDPTETIRRQLVPDMPVELRAAFHNDEPIWTTAQMTDEFEVLGFQAPYVAVKRKSDGIKGSLMFTHSPRYYFGWLADQGFRNE